MFKISRNISNPIPAILPQVDRRFIWIGLGLLTFLLGQLFSWNPNFTEIFYSRGIFLGFRWIWDHTLGKLPFPLLYLFVPLLLFWIGRKIRITLRNYKPLKWRHRLGSLFLSVLAFVSGVYFLFQFLWGFNYFRVPVQEQLQLEVNNLDSLDIQREVQWATARLLADRAAIPNAQNRPLSYEDLPDNLEDSVRLGLESLLRQSGYPTWAAHVRGRVLSPNGFLLRLGASGIYIPFVGEGHVDAALAPVSRPFTLAHELSHGYGFGDEGTANFWGYVATQASTNPAIRYSGSMAYWRYTARSLALLHPTSFQALRDSLPPAVIQDLQAIRKVYDTYPDFFPSFNDLVYNSYLKSQGIPEGTLSYNKIVPMVRAWRENVERVE
ncbi:MAG: DUF3810 domain-containing protein [Bacteroidota bacterium]